MFEELLYSPDPAPQLRRLLDAGVDPNVRDQRGGTALYAVAGRPELIRMLIEAGADPNQESTAEGEGLPLCFAACWGLMDAVLALLEGGANPNLREDVSSGYSALHWAAQGGHADTVKVLLDAGADPNAPIGEDRRPLHTAALRGSVPVAKILLAARADPEVQDQYGDTPFALAMRWGNPNAELAKARALAAAGGSELSWRTITRADETVIELTFRSERGVEDSYDVYPGIVDLLSSAAESA